MPSAEPSLEDRFAGCLFGLAVGDALGGKFEAQSGDAIRSRFPSADHLIAYPRVDILITGSEVDTIPLERRRSCFARIRRSVGDPNAPVPASR